MTGYIKNLQQKQQKRQQKQSFAIKDDDVLDKYHKCETRLKRH